MIQEKYIAELHAEHRLWKSQLLLAKDQLKSYQNRLEEIIIANNSKNILAEIEQFQNQFMSENEVIDTLLHEIGVEEVQLAENIRENNVATEHRKSLENLALMERMDVFNKLFFELGLKFTSFLSKTL